MSSLFVWRRVHARQNLLITKPRRAQDVAASPVAAVGGATATSTAAPDSCRPQRRVFAERQPSLQDLTPKAHSGKSNCGTLLHRPDPQNRKLPSNRKPRNPQPRPPILLSGIWPTLCSHHSRLRAPGHTAYMSTSLQAKKAPQAVCPSAAAELQMSTLAASAMLLELGPAAMSMNLAVAE